MVERKPLRRTVAALAAFMAATLRAAAADPLPSYATADQATQIHGSVSSINQRDLTLRDDHGFLDHVVLHDGTVINPTGTEIAPGQVLTIYGRSEGDAFSASEIDAAADTYAPVADPADPYVPYFDPYFDPYFGYGYGYGAFGGTSVFFGFGDHFGGRRFGGRGFGERGFDARGFGGHGSGGISVRGSAHGGGRGR